MNKMDWQQAFGPTPDEFRERVNSTLNRLEDKEMHKRTKFSTALIAAILTITLLTGAAFAAAQLNIWEALNYSEPLIPLEGADELVTTDLAAAETDYFRVIVQEGVYDGFGAIVKLRFKPKDPEKYVLLTDFGFPNNLKDEYNIETIELENDAVQERITRKDGKEIIFLSTPSLTVGNENSSSASHGNLNLFNSYIDQYNSDGSAEFWINGNYSENLPDVLNIALNVRGMDAEYNTVYGSIENLTFDLVKNNKERTVKLVPVDSGKIEGFELIEAKINFTEVRGYIGVEYTGSAEEHGMGISLRLLDEDGNEINTGSGQCWEPENGLFRWEMEMQSFDEIPETMILEVHVIGENNLGQIRCSVEPVTE